jgi:hypothetical protein
VKTFSVKRRLSTGKDVFWIASVLFIILLTSYTLVSTKVTSYDAFDLGLLTKLPITFWIGLVLLGILLYISTRFERRTILFLVVILIIFYLFGIPTLVRENKAEALGLSYWLSSKATYILQVGSVNFAQNPWDLTNWPGFFFLSAFLSSITGLPATVFSDYFPLLTIALLGVFAYYVFRSRFKASYSCLGALWVIASLWTGQHYFSPQATAFVMYFAILLLLKKFLLARKQISIVLSVTILFAAAVFTHLLTSFFILVGVFAVYALYKINRKPRTGFFSFSICALLATIFFTYQASIVAGSFHEIIKVLSYQFMRQESPISVSLQARAGGSTSLFLQLMGTYAITIMTVFLAVVAILATTIGLILHKKETKDDLFWIAWILCAAAMGLSLVYGAEAINRAFMFMLLPTSYFAVKFLSKKPAILILVLVLLTFTLIPALYSNQNYAYVPTSELKGDAFYTKYTLPAAPFFYEPISCFLPYGTINGTQITLSAITGIRSLPSQEIINEATREAQFIIYSNLETNFYLYYYGVDPLVHLNLDYHRNRIYDNEQFRIYARIQ